MARSKRLSSYPADYLRLASALAPGQTLTRTFPTRKEAESVRFTFYSVRVAVRAECAEAQFPAFTEATFSLIPLSPDPLGPTELRILTRSPGQGLGFLPLPSDSATTHTPAHTHPPTERHSAHPPAPYQHPRSAPAQAPAQPPAQTDDIATSLSATSAYIDHFTNALDEWFTERPSDSANEQTPALTPAND